MTEAELLDDVAELADSLGILYHHCHDSRRCDGARGFPDLVLAGRRGVLLAELKPETGEMGPGQPAWLERVGGVVWRPSDYRSGIIRRRLEAIA